LWSNHEISRTFSSSAFAAAKATSNPYKISLWVLKQCAVGQIRGDEAHFRFCEFGTPSGHFRPKLTAWDPLGLFMTILERYGQLLKIFDQFRTILDLFDHFGPVGPKWPK